MATGLPGCQLTLVGNRVASPQLLRNAREINASNIEKDIKWMEEDISGDVTLKNISDDTSLLAVQGKNSIHTLQKLTDVDLSAIEYYKFVLGNVAGQEVIISHTGYTGEKICFEIYSSSNVEKSEALWNAIFEAGKKFNIKPRRTWSEGYIET